MYCSFSPLRCFSYMHFVLICTVAVLYCFVVCVCPHWKCLHFVVVVGLEWLKDPKSYAGGSLLLVGSPLSGRSKVMAQTKRGTLVLQVGGWAAGWWPTPVKNACYENSKNEPRVCETETNLAVFEGWNLECLMDGWSDEGCREAGSQKLEEQGQGGDFFSRPRPFMGCSAWEWVSECVCVCVWMGFVMCLFVRVL